MMGAARRRPGTRRWARPTADERAAVLVEFAILLPLFLMLVFGVISYGVAFSRKLDLQTAVREGGRYAATLPGADTQMAAIRDVTVAAASGELDGLGTDGRRVCVAVTLDGTTWSALENSTATGSPCFADGRPAGEARVQVLAERPSEVNAVLFRRDVTLTTKSVARYEATS